MSIQLLRFRRFVTVAAFVAAVLVAGCSSLWPVGQGAKAPANEPVASNLPMTARAPMAGLDGAMELPPPIVNIFGEFGGIEHPMAEAGIESGLQQHTVCDEGYDADPSLDPTAKWVVYSSTRHSEHADIYLQRTDGTSVIQLTSDPADDAQPVFSPDGKRIAFCSTRAGNWDLYVMDIDGRNVQQLTNTPAQEMHPSFSPDGTRLAYCSLSPRSDQWELWTLNLATLEKKMVGQGLFPSWSPRKDVDRIAFQRARQRGSRWFSLWTLDLVEGEPRRLTEVAVSSNAAVVSPCWSPDGTHLAFATIMAAARSAEGTTPGRQEIWIASADGSGRQRMTEGLGTNLSPFWGVGNRIYFISDRSGHENVWSVQVDAAPTMTAAADEMGHGNPKEQAVGRPEAGHATPAVNAEHKAPTEVGATDVQEVSH